MRLWIDDVRPAPEGYTWVRTVREAIAIITVSEGLEGEAKYTNSELQGQFKVELIDMDHDSGRFGPPDYIKLLDWLEHTGRNYPIRIHSMNPVGVANMRRIIERNGWEEVPYVAAELKGIDRSRCNKCVYELYCSKNKDNERKCPDYKRDAPDGGYYG